MNQFGEGGGKYLWPNFLMLLRIQQTRVRRIELMKSVEQTVETDWQTCMGRTVK